LKLQGLFIGFFIRIDAEYKLEAQIKLGLGQGSVFGGGGHAPRRTNIKIILKIGFYRIISPFNRVNY
jgi:hypothetical protein